MEGFEFSYDDIEPINYGSHQISLESDLEEIYNNTQNTTIDWKKRETSLTKLGKICLGDQGKSEIFIKFFNTQLFSHLSIQLADLRSSVMKEACRIISLCAKELGILIETAVNQMLSQYVLFKIAGSANRVICDSSTKCIFNLVKYVNSIKIINSICSQKAMKSNVVRIICAQSISYIMFNYKKNLIIKTNAILKETIKILLSDANGEVRANTRKAFIAFRKRFPSQGDELYEILEKNVQKQINEDEKTYGENININENEIAKKNNNICTVIKKNSGKASLAKSPNFKLNDVKYNINNIDNNTYDIKNFSEDTHTTTDNTYESRKKLGKSFNAKDIIYKQLKDKMNNSNLRAKTSKFNNNEKYLIKSSLENNSNNNDNILPPINSYCVSNNNGTIKLTKKSHANSALKDEIINRNNKNKIYNTKSNRLKSVNKNIKTNIKIIKDNNIDNRIMMLINKLNLIKKPKDKLLIFQYLFNDFNEILNAVNENNINETTLDTFVDVHTQYLSENDQLLTEQIIKNLMRMIFYMSQIFKETDIEIIVKLLLTKINLDIKSTTKLSYELLEIIRRKCNIEYIYNSIISLIVKNIDNVELNDICYEYLSLLINQNKTFLEDGKYYKKTFCLLLNAKIESKKIDKLIQILYDNYKNNFISIYKNLKNKQKINAILEINNIQILQELNKKFSTSSKQNAIQNNNFINEIPEEVIICLETGDLNSFITYINKNENYIPNFLMLLSDNNYINNSKYMKNCLNFIYSLIDSNKYKKILSQVLETLINQVIHFLLLDPENQIFINLTKDILVTLPLKKINNEKYFKTISKYLDLNSNQILIRILLGSIKNFVKTDKNNRDIENYLEYFIEGVLKLLNHPMSEIRKIAVYCCVEIYLVVGNDFEKYMQDIPKSQQNLINLFVKKRTG